MSIKRTVVTKLLTIKHLTTTIDSICQRQRSDGFSQHPFHPREHLPLHFTGTPPSGYLRLFKREMTCPSQTCHCLTGGDCSGGSTVCCDGRGGEGGREGALVSRHIFRAPMEATERGQREGWREIGGLVVSCSLSP